MSVSEYGKRELDPRWISLVESILPFKAVKVCNCRKQFSGWKDDNGHVFYRASLCQERDVCPVCGKVYTESLVADAVDVIGKVARATCGKVKFASVEFTLPREGWARVREEDLSVLRRMGWEVLKEVVGVFDEDGNESFFMAGIGASHYWHSKDPFSGWFPHFHFTLLDLVYDIKEGVFRRINLFLNPDQLRMLSYVWRDKFEVKYGKTRARRFDVHWRYSTGYGHLKHRLSYALRRPVVDCYKVVYQAKNNLRVNLEWAERLLSPPKKEKRVQWYGWLSDGVKSGFLSKLDIVLKKKAERVEERRKIYCPICGSELYLFQHGIEYDFLANEGHENLVLAYSKQREVIRWPR